MCAFVVAAIICCPDRDVMDKVACWLLRAHVARQALSSARVFGPSAPGRTPRGVYLYSAEGCMPLLDITSYCSRSAARSGCS